MLQLLHCTRLAECSRVGITCVVSCTSLVTRVQKRHLNVHMSVCWRFTKLFCSNGYDENSGPEETTKVNFKMVLAIFLVSLVASCSCSHEVTLLLPL